MQPDSPPTAVRHSRSEISSWSQDTAQQQPRRSKRCTQPSMKRKNNKNKQEQQNHNICYLSGFPAPLRKSTSQKGLREALRVGRSGGPPGTLKPTNFSPLGPPGPRPWSFFRPLGRPRGDPGEGTDHFFSMRKKCTAMQAAVCFS